MNKIEKQLLLKDLCARLPYNVIVSKSVYGHEPELYYLDLYKLAELRDGDPVIIKPYLRPMSSMTEEECEEVGKHVTIYDTVDWMNKHHFDYHRLIEKGLALEAPEGMYKQ